MVATDRLPEFVHYQDKGCSIAPHCLACPLPACKWDMPSAKDGKGIIREREVMRLLGQGLSVLAVAREMNLSARHVLRHKAAAKARQAGEG